MLPLVRQEINDRVRPRIDNRSLDLVDPKLLVFTDPDSVKISPSMNMIQRYVADAAADAAPQLIVAADVTDLGTEQAMVAPATPASCIAPARSRLRSNPAA